MAKSAGKKAEPKAADSFFKVIKNSKSSGKSSTLPSYQASKATAKAVDSYFEMQTEVKLLEGKAEAFKNEVLSEVKLAFAQRMFEGKKGNLKILGEKESVTFITQNSGSMLTQEDLEILNEKFSKKTTEALTEPDLGSLRFNPNFINSENTQKRLFQALSKAFTKEELDDMFLPIGHKVRENVIDRAVEHVKSAEKLADLYQSLKLKAYIKI